MVVGGHYINQTVLVQPVFYLYHVPYPSAGEPQCHLERGAMT